MAAGMRVLGLPVTPETVPMRIVMERCSRCNIRLDAIGVNAEEVERLTIADDEAPGRRLHNVCMRARRAERYHQRMRELYPDDYTDTGSLRLV